MKLISGILIVIIGILTGNLLSEKFCLRKKFFNDFLLFHQTLINETNFSQKTIKEVLKELDESSFSKLTYDYFINNVDFPKMNYLKEDEYLFYKEYVSKIGKMDKNTQLSYLLSCSAQITKYYDNSSNEEKRYKGLYIKLGFLIGLIILVVIL